MPSAASFLDSIESPTCVLDGAGRITAANLAWREFVVANGCDPSQAVTGSSYFEVCEQQAGYEPTAAAEVRSELRRLLAGHLLRFEFEYASRGPVRERWFSVRASPLTETPGAILIHVDVTATKRVQLARASQVVRDAVTFGSDRQALTSRLASALASAGDGGEVAVAFVHVDSLQKVIADLGTSGATEVLHLVAERLAPDPAHLVSRFAVEDFVVVWPELKSAADATWRADALEAAFRAPFVLETESASVWLTARVGVAFAASSDRPHDLLVAADAAMRSSHRGARGCTRVYTEEVGAGRPIALAERDMREAIARREFVLHYQPVVDLQRGVVTGVEALARWPSGGRLGMPEDFVPIAEGTGLIVPLGQWVLEEACGQAAHWASQGLDLDMAVNLSVRQISHSEVPATIKSTLEQAGLDPRRLLVEVTESVVMEDAEAAQQTLWQIAQLGVGIGIDDFGTGYSSLLYLKRYPVNALKIDKSFVAGLGVNADDDGIVAGIVGLGRAVGAACIAEGVETSAQLATLTDLGCSFAQGFLLGQPVVAAEIPETVARCHRFLETRPGQRLVAHASP